MEQETLNEILNTLKLIEERLERIEDLVDPNKTFERLVRENGNVIARTGQSPIRV